MLIGCIPKTFCVVLEKTIAGIYIYISKSDYYSLEYISLDKEAPSRLHVCDLR